MGIGKTLRVRWHVSARDTPRIWRHCRQCETKRPFICSGKFRSNAQKKRLDVWLIYRCASCGQSWNCPVLERRPVAELDPALLLAVTRNDPAQVRRVAFDADHLARHCERVETAGGLRVEKHPDGPASSEAAILEIALVVEAGCEIRLERLLARELGLSRGQLRQLHERAALSVSPARRAVLRQAARQGQCVRLELRGLGINSDRLAEILDGAFGTPTRVLESP